MTIQDIERLQLAICILAPIAAVAAGFICYQLVLRDNRNEVTAVSRSASVLSEEDIEGIAALGPDYRSFKEAQEAGEPVHLWRGTDGKPLSEENWR